MANACLRDRWATAIAGRTDRLRIGADFGAVDADRRWPDQLPHDAPYAVRLANAEGRYPTLALDFDASRGDAALDADRFCDVLEHAGIAFVSCLSSGDVDGGRHVFVPMRRSPTAKQAARAVRAIADLCPSLDVSPMLNPIQGCIRPPLAPHKHGGSSRIVRATRNVGAGKTIAVDVDEAIDAFEVGNDRDAFAWLLAAVRQPRRARTRQRLDAAIRDNQPTGSDRTSSAARWRIVLEAQHGGYTAAQVLARCDALNPLLGDLLRRPHADGLSLLEYELRQAERKPGVVDRSRPDDAILVTLREWTRMLSLDLWRTGEAFRLRETLRVLLARAARAHTLEVTCSATELADALGCSRARASELRDQLCALLPGLTLEQHADAAARAKDAATIRLSPIGGEKPDSSTTAGVDPLRGLEGIQNLTTLDELPTCDPRDLTDRTPDLYASHAGGAGPRGHQIVLLLVERPRTTAELTAALALTDQRHVRRYHLHRLVELGLVARHANGTWYAVPGTVPDRIGFEHGCTARAGARRVRHVRLRLEWDRRRYDRACDHYAARAASCLERHRDGLTVEQLGTELGIHSPALRRDVVARALGRGAAARLGDRLHRAGVPEQPRLVDVAPDRPRRSIDGLPALATRVARALADGALPTASVAELARISEQDAHAMLRLLAARRCATRLGARWQLAPELGDYLAGRDRDHEPSFA